MTAENNNEAVESHVTVYFDCEVTVWRTSGLWPSYPWRYAVTYKGKKREFSGVPNYLETKKAALKKAWWRAKWLSDGTFGSRYI